MLECWFTHGEKGQCVTMGVTMGVGVPDVQDNLQKKKDVHAQNHDAAFPDEIFYALFLMIVCPSFFFIVIVKIKGLVCMYIKNKEKNEQNKRINKKTGNNK